MQAPLLPARPQPVATYDLHTGLAVPRVAVAMVFLTIFMDTLASTISTPALPYYAREFGASNAAIGYLFAAWSFTSTFCAPMLGRLSDRIGRKEVLLLSLVGSGVANFGQASATSYWVLFVWRALSGMWAAVTSTAQVYMTDVCSPEVLNDYLARLAAVPGAAMIFGPGIGGGLATFGLNFPVLVDGALSMAAAVLVYVYLPEAPERVQTSPLSPKAAVSSAAAEKPKTITPVPKLVYVLGVSGFLSGIAFGTRVSMQVVALNAKFGMTALQVGYVYIVFALVSLMQSFWISPVVQRRFGVFTVATVGTIMQGFFTPLGFAFTEGLWPCLFFLALGNSGFAFRNAANGPLTALFCDASNRGAVFAQVQMFTNFGRMVGPVVAGHLAELDAVTLPWYFAGSCCMLSALMLPVLRRGTAPGTRERRTISGFTDLLEGEVVFDETGTPEDYQRVGEFVGRVLQERNYPWVSHQQAVLEMLDRLLPRLRSSGSDQVEDLELLATHAEHLQHEFSRAGGNRQRGFFA